MIDRVISTQEQLQALSSLIQHQYERGTLMTDKGSKNKTIRTPNRKDKVYVQAKEIHAFGKTTNITTLPDPTEVIFKLGPSTRAASNGNSNTELVAVEVHLAADKIAFEQFVKFHGEVIQLPTEPTAAIQGKDVKDEKLGAVLLTGTDRYFSFYPTAGLTLQLHQQVTFNVIEESSVARKSHACNLVVEGEPVPLFLGQVEGATIRCGPDKMPLKFPSAALRGQQSLNDLAQRKLKRQSDTLAAVEVTNAFLNNDWVSFKFHYQLNPAKKTASKVVAEETKLTSHSTQTIWVEVCTIKDTGYTFKEVNMFADEEYRRLFSPRFFSWSYKETLTYGTRFKADISLAAGGKLSKWVISKVEIDSMVLYRPPATNGFVEKCDQKDGEMRIRFDDGSVSVPFPKRELKVKALLASSTHVAKKSRTDSSDLMQQNDDQHEGSESSEEGQQDPRQEATLSDPNPRSETVSNRQQTQPTQKPFKTGSFVQFSLYKEVKEPSLKRQHDEQLLHVVGLVRPRMLPHNLLSRTVFGHFHIVKKQSLDEKTKRYFVPNATFDMADILLDNKLLQKTVIEMRDNKPHYTTTSEPWGYCDNDFVQADLAMSVENGSIMAVNPKIVGEYDQESRMLNRLKVKDGRIVRSLECVSLRLVASSMRAERRFYTFTTLRSGTEERGGFVYEVHDVKPLENGNVMDFLRMQEALQLRE